MWNIFYTGLHRLTTFFFFAEHSDQHLDQKHLQRPQPQREEDDQDHAAQVRDKEAEGAAGHAAAPRAPGQGGRAYTQPGTAAAAASGQDAVQNPSPAAAAAVAAAAAACAAATTTTGDRFPNYFLAWYMPGFIFSRCGWGVLY
jgi:hypothetical protein